MRAFLSLVSLTAVFQGLDTLFLGDITPTDPNVVLNDTLELNCTVKENTGFHASELFWRVHGKNAPQSEMFIVDNRTLQLRKTVTSTADEGTYSCMRRGPNDTETFVGATDVRVEYVAVREVSNFTCIVDEFRGALYCEWKLGKYKHKGDLDIKILASFNAGMNTIKCPHTPSENCTWTRADGDIFASSVIINLTISNKIFGSEKSKRFDFTSKEILKLKPASGIQHEVLTSCSCVNLTWNPREGNSHTTTKILLNSKWDTKRITVNSTAATICDLVPDSAYKLELQQKLTNGLHYSDATARKFNTCIIAPSQGPTVFPGGFSADNHLCESSNRMRNITLYWKKIPEKLQNGAVLNYNIISERGKIQSFDGGKSSGSISIPCDSRHVLNVTGCNSAGCSPHSSITLPDYNEVLPPDHLIVEEIDADEIYLFWNGTQNGSTIVWCKGKAALQMCQDEINTLPITPSENGAKVKRNEINQSFDDVIFGISITYGTYIGTGIRWQERCRYTKGWEPRKPQNVQLLPEPPNDCLMVQWSPQGCDMSTAQNAYVHSYKISYCQVDEQGICKNNEDVNKLSVPADGVMPYKIRDLEAEQKYGVWVTAVSLSTESQKSDVIIGIPKNDDLTDGVIVSIIFGGMFSFVLIISGLVCITRQLRKKIGLDESFPIQNIPIHRYNDNIEENDIYSQPNQSRYTQFNAIPDDEDISYEEMDATSNGNAVMRKTDSDEELKILLVPRQLSKDSGRSSASATSAVSQLDESSRNDIYVDELVRHHGEVSRHSPTRTPATISANCPFSSEQREETDDVEHKKLNDFIFDKKEHLTKGDDFLSNSQLMLKENGQVGKYPVKEEPTGLPKTSSAIQNVETTLMDDFYFPNTSPIVQNTEPVFMEDGYLPNTPPEIQQVEPTFMEDGYLPNTPITIQNAEPTLMENGYLPNTSSEIQRVELTFMEDGYLPNTVQNADEKGPNYPSCPATDHALEDYSTEEQYMKETFEKRYMKETFEKRIRDCDNSVKFNAQTKSNDKRNNSESTEDDVSPNNNHRSSRSTNNGGPRFSCSSDYTQIHTTTNRISSSNSMEDSGSLNCRVLSNTEMMPVFDDPYIPLETLLQ